MDYLHHEKILTDPWEYLDDMKRTQGDEENSREI